MAGAVSKDKTIRWKSPTNPLLPQTFIYGPALASQSGGKIYIFQATGSQAGQMTHDGYLSCVSRSLSGPGNWERNQTPSIGIPFLLFFFSFLCDSPLGHFHTHARVALQCDAFRHFGPTYIIVWPERNPSKPQPLAKGKPKFGNTKN